jgi:hypothetical protein
MQFDFKKIRIDLLAIGIFLVVSFLYCLPQLQGKKLQQSDNIQWQAMAHEGMAYHDSTGKDVLWSNSMFGGMPSYTTYIAAKNVNYPYYLQQMLYNIGKPACFFFIAMLCFYILMRVLKVNKWLGMIGAFAYAFSSYNAIIIVVGHETKMLTLCFLPLAMAGLFLIYQKRWLTGAAITSLGLALMFSNAHYQVLYYSAIMFFCFGIGNLFIAIKEHNLKNFAISTVIALVSTLIGVGPTVSTLLTTNEYGKATMRGGESELSGHDAKPNGGLDKEYAFRWSNGIGETFCLMVPYLYGGASGESADKAPKTAEAVGSSAEELPLYWGPQPFISGPVFFGAVICFLFVLGMLVIRSANKWWILAACIFTIMMSWGNHLEGFNYFLFDHLPMLNKFRTVSMALVIPQFLFPMLGIWALQEVMNQKNYPEKMMKDLKIAAGITAGLCLLVGVGSSLFFNFTGGEDAQLQPEMVKLLKEDRASLAVTSGIKSAVYILIAAGLLWAYLKDMIKPVVLFSGLAVIIAIDLLPVSHDYLNDSKYVDASDYEAAFVPRDVDRQIMQDRDPYYRVLDLSKNPYNDASQAYFHKCVGGYSPAKMEIYQDLIDRQLSKGFNAQVLNMLNTKYVIAGGQKRPPMVVPNPGACGNAWFVSEVKWANTADEEMNGLNAGNFMDTTVVPNAFEPKKTAVIRSSFKDQLGSYTFGKDSSAGVKLAQYGLDDISFTSSNSKDGLAVFSDIYYAKGWKAFVDGKETPIIKADYVLRAIKIPAGNHKIEFHFHPDSFYNGQKVGLASSILLILLCLGALFPLVRKEQLPAQKP